MKMYIYIYIAVQHFSHYAMLFIIEICAFIMHTSNGVYIGPDSIYIGSVIFFIFSLIFPSHFRKT